ncbi:MAG: hypothetical protein Fur0025_00790 [Oscillatoriaceae cyanobacterium]
MEQITAWELDEFELFAQTAAVRKISGKIGDIGGGGAAMADVRLSADPSNHFARC